MALLRVLNSFTLAGYLKKNLRPTQW